MTQSTTNLRFRDEVFVAARALQRANIGLGLLEAQRQAVKEVLLAALADPDNVADVLHDLIEWLL